jgi:hypothetical protein
VRLGSYIVASARRWIDSDLRHRQTHLPSSFYQEKQRMFDCPCANSEVRSPIDGVLDHINTILKQTLEDRTDP